MSFVKQQLGINLADARLGAKVVSVTDEFFAPCHRMLSPEAPVFIAGKFDDHGKWMDGWESRRKRVAGYDHCVIELATAGTIDQVDIDTSNFIGNFPSGASLEGCYLAGGAPDAETQWDTIISETRLSKDSSHLLDSESNKEYTHVRLNIFPDGGVARLKVYGKPSLSKIEMDEVVDLASLLNGGRVIACSDECFGSSMTKLNYPDQGRDMGDGWETARRRTPGNDWVIIQLAQPSVLESIELDTAHYKGNFPDRASVQAGFLDSNSIDIAVNQSLFWPQLMGEKKLEADSVSRFVLDGSKQSAVTHVKINIMPDGGLSRVRLYGRVAND